MYNIRFVEEDVVVDRDLTFEDAMSKLTEMTTLHLSNYDVGDEYHIMDEDGNFIYGAFIKSLEITMFYGTDIAELRKEGYSQISDNTFEKQLNFEF